MRRDAAPYTRAYLGSCGSGKSFAMAMAVAADLARGIGPFLVMDLSASDWPGAPLRGHRFARVATVDGAIVALGEGERLVIVSPRAVDAETAAELGAELADVAYEHGDGCTLVLPEAHTVAPQAGTKLPDSIERIAHRWRHAGGGSGCRYWIDTQYTQYISKRILRACECWYWFTTGTGAEVDPARELDRDIPADIRKVAELATAGTASIVDPGWHVRIPRYTPHQRRIVSPSGEEYTPEQASALE